MAIGLVHDIHGLIVFGLSYACANRKKDSAARYAPGLRHRDVRHNWYRAFGRTWDLTNPFPDVVRKRTERIRATLDPARAEEYMASISHDYLDRIWDFDDLSPEERAFTRKYWEGFHVWLLLNPKLLKHWAGVEVLGGKIHRVIDGDELWEDAPEVRAEYGRLYRRACFLLRRDKELRRMVEEYGGFSMEPQTVQ